MKTAAEYFVLSEQYRTAKLNEHDNAVRYQLEIFERSYFLLGKSTELLDRSKSMQEELEKKQRR